MTQPGKHDIHDIALIVGGGPGISASCARLFAKNGMAVGVAARDPDKSVLEDLEKTLREDYSFETDIFPIPSENAHLELMLKIGDMIKKHESEDTLFVIYYGGHAKIDESRQSTWCAYVASIYSSSHAGQFANAEFRTRHPASPWLQ